MRDLVKYACLRWNILDANFTLRKCVPENLKMKSHSGPRGKNDLRLAIYKQQKSSFQREKGDKHLIIFF